MFPSTFRYLGTRSVTNPLSQEKIKIDLRKVMFPPAFRYIWSATSDAARDRILYEKDDMNGLTNERLTRPLTIVLQIDNLLSCLVKLKEYPEDMACSLSYRIDKLQISVENPKRSSLNYVFYCYCLSKWLRIDFGLSILGRLFKKDCVPDEVISHKSGLDGLSGMFKENRSCETRELFYKIVIEKSCGIDIDAVTYGTLIDALCKEGHSMIALEVLRIMEKGHFPLGIQRLNMIMEGWFKEQAIYSNLEHFYGLGLCKERNVYSVLKSFYELAREDMIRGNYIYNALVRGLCDMSLDRKIYRDVWMQHGGIGDGVEDALVDMMEKYSLRGQLRKARKVFRFIGRHDLPKTDCYSILIKGHCRNKKNIVHVMPLYREMLYQGLKPDVWTYKCILKGLFNAGRCSVAVQFFHEMQVVGLKPRDFICEIMLRGLYKHGQLGRAKDLLKLDDVFRGFLMRGEYRDASNLLKEMLARGLSPASLELEFLVDLSEMERNPTLVEMLDSVKSTRKCL